MNPKEAVLSPKEVKALRRSGGGAAITAARAARGLPEAGHPGASGNTSRVIAISGASKTEDELVPRASSRTGAPPSQQQSPPRQWTSAAASVAEPLRGVTEYVICRHNKGSFSLYQLLQHGDRAHAAEGAAERVFVLAARAEGGGISSFLRLYTEPATSGLTPGKSAPSYVGKLTGGSSAALWLRRDKGTAAAQKPERLTGPKLAHLEVKYSKKPLPSGARQLSVRVPIQNTLPAGSASASYDVQVLANIVKGWHTFEAIDPWFLPESPGGAHPPLLALPLNGMAPSVKNVAMRVVPKVGAGNSYGSGFGGYGSSVAAEGASASGPGTPTRRTSSGGAWSGDGVSAVSIEQSPVRVLPSGPPIPTHQQQRRQQQEPEPEDGVGYFSSPGGGVRLLSGGPDATGWPSQCNLRFGKSATSTTGQQEYLLLCSSPFSPLQAFAVALSSLTL